MNSSHILSILIPLALILHALPAPLARAANHPAQRAQGTGTDEGRPVVESAPPVLQTPSARAASLNLIPTAATELPDAVAEEDWNYDPTSTYDQKGLFQPRGFQAGAPAETIDPFSGNLVLAHTDLNLPGVAGLDLSLNRIYNSKIHRNYAAVASGDPGRVANGILFVPTSPLGLGWTMHLGRLVGAVNGGPNNALAGPRYYERSDGSQHPFFTYTGEGCGDETSDFCLLTKQLDNPYRVATDMPWHIATASGLNITFDHSAFDGANVVHYATEIRDANGNAIQVTYHDDTIPGIGYPRDYFRHFIDTIVDSANRTIQFGYSEVNPGTVRLTSITAVGRTMRYYYSAEDPWPGLQAFLTRVEPPAGGAWRYQYDGLTDGNCANNSRRWCELTQVTYPTGGVIDYSYEHRVFWAQNNPVSVRAITERVISGPSVEEATWTYTYNRAADYAGDEHTVITRPDGSQEISTFFGIGAGVYNPLGLAWKAGVLLQKRIRADGNIIQSETYDWIAGRKISDEIWGDPWIGFDVGVFLPRLRERVIRRGNLTWTTTHTTFNETNNTPRCVTETGPDGATRYRVQAFFGNPDLVQQGDFFFRITGKPALKVMSYNPFSADACNDDLEDVPIAPAVEDEFEVTAYDNLGRVASQMVNSVYTEYHYNPNGTQQSVITFRVREQGSDYSDGVCTMFASYQYGEPRLIQYGGIGGPQNASCSSFLQTEQRAVNQDGSIASQTNALGQTTTYVYDGLGRLEVIRPPGVAEIRVSIDGDSSTRTSLERVEQSAYWLEKTMDGFGRSIQEESSAGVLARRTYNALGRMVFQSLPVDASNPPDPLPGTSFTYDALGRTIQVVQPGGITTDYAYGTNADTVTMTRDLPGGARVTVHTRRAYADPDDTLLMRVQLPGEDAPESDTYTYLVGGHLASISYGDRQHLLNYNYAKKVVSHFSPETGLWTYYGYDAAGNLRCRSLANSSCFNSTWSSDAQVYYEVDRLGRNTKIQYNGGSADDVYLYYNADSNLNRIVDAAGSHTFTYFPGGRVQTQTSVISGVTYITSYTYNDLGDIETITYPAGRVVTYEYDAGRRIRRVPGFVNQIEYHPSGVMRRLVYANGVATTLSLDGRLQPQRLTAPNVVDLEYDFDAAGNLISLTDRIQSANNATFSYDDLDRMLSATGPWGTLAFDYNENGDRTEATFNGETTTYSYDEQATLTGEGLLTGLSGAVNLEYQYDARGNVVARGDLRYAYDTEDRLTRVSDALNQTLLTNVYDGQGRRAKMIRAGCDRAIIYHHDQFGNRIAESTDDGLMLKETVYSGGRAVAELDLNPLAVPSPLLDFGEVETGTTVTKTLTLQNRSSAAMTLDQVLLGAPFAVGSTLPLNIPANGNGTLALTFNPTDEAAYLGDVALCDRNGVPLFASVQGQSVDAITGYSAAPNGIDGGADDPIFVTFRRQIAPASVGPQSFVVHAMQLGQLLSVFGVTGSEIRLTPEDSLRAGELINVTLTTNLRYVGGGAPGSARVFQFWVAPKPSSGQFDGAATQLTEAAAADGSISKIELGDLDGDGDLDAFVARLPDKPNQVWFNDGSGVFTDSGQALGNHWSEDVALGDLDGDGDLDAFVANSGTNPNSRANRIYINNGSGVFTLGTQFPNSDETIAVALGDLDGDGDLDAIVANSDVIFTPGYSPLNRVYLNDGNANFTTVGVLGANRTRDVAIGDLDNDGDLDAIVANNLSGQTALVYLNEGDARFRGGFSLGISGDAVALGDLDGDGDLDALLNNRLLRNDGTGTFTNEGTFLAASGPLFLADILLADLDGDGDLDAYGVSSSGLGPDTVWFNDGTSAMTQDAQNLASESNTTAALGDLDGDGDLDVFRAPDLVWMNRDGPPANNHLFLPRSSQK